MRQTREDVGPTASGGLFKRVDKTHYLVEQYASKSNIMVYSWAR